MRTISFDNGDEMPMLGLGTWKSAPGDAYEAVKTALDAGYRHVDCAAIYKNEPEVGEALAESLDAGVADRDDVWVTSKLWNDAHAPEHVRPALEQTLDDLQLDALDLYLVHWPVAFERGVDYPESTDEFVSLDEIPLTETWAAMEDLKAEGLVRHIGVSNFNIPKLQLLIDAGRVKPEMNQIELHPYLQQPEMLSFAADEGIPLTAYSPLGSRDRPEEMKAEDEPVLLENPTIHEIAERHDATPAQVLISWALHRDTVVIPKSTTPAHIRENLAATELELTDDDMEAIAALDQGYRYVSVEDWTIEGSPYTQSLLWEE
jgi:alcohol dehydrogenase (NADP+)